MGKHARALDLPVEPYQPDQANRSLLLSATRSDEQIRFAVIYNLDDGQRTTRRVVFEELISPEEARTLLLAARAHADSALRRLWPDDEEWAGKHKADG